jgi:hypothetical protein
LCRSLSLDVSLLLSGLGLRVLSALHLRRWPHGRLRCRLNLAAPGLRRSLHGHLLLS